MNHEAIHNPNPHSYQFPKLPEGYFFRVGRAGRGDQNIWIMKRVGPFAWPVMHTWIFWSMGRDAMQDSVHMLMKKFKVRETRDERAKLAGDYPPNTLP